MLQRTFSFVKPDRLPSVWCYAIFACSTPCGTVSVPVSSIATIKAEIELKSNAQRVKYISQLYRHAINGYIMSSHRDESFPISRICWLNAVGVSAFYAAIIIAFIQAGKCSSTWQSIYLDIEQYLFCRKWSLSTSRNSWSFGRSSCWRWRPQ